MPQKPFIRVRVTDGKPREWTKLKAALGTFVDVRQDGSATCFKLATDTERQLSELRPKLGALGLEELAADSHVTAPSIASPTDSKQQGQAARSTSRSAGSNRISQPTVEQGSRKKPYSFVSLPESFDASDPVWHDGSSSTERLSGEIRFEIKNLTPLLVGWERQKLSDLAVQMAAQPGVRCEELPWTEALEKFATEAAEQTYPDPIKEKQWPRVLESRKKYVDKLKKNQLDESHKDKAKDKPKSKVVQASILDHDCRWLADQKSILCPLRSPWEHRPVLIPGDSLKGFLRHELGALLGAPMERVAERAYSYRPNLAFPDLPEGIPKLQPRLAKVLTTATVCVEGKDYPAPNSIAVFQMMDRYAQAYFPRRNGREIENAPPGAYTYRGGMGAGQMLPKDCLSEDAQKRIIHKNLELRGGVTIERPSEAVSADTIAQYQRTLEHYFSGESGHFSARNPHIGSDATVKEKGIDALKAGAKRAFQPGDLIWVEWDTSKKEIVSFGWHYYYRWAYQDTVRRKGGTAERDGLFPLREEKGDKPEKLSAVRRLFGYATDQKNDGTLGIGKGNHSQLMGRISVNAAIEVIEPGKARDEDRFEKPIFLKELGQPKPSAVENYLKQPYHPKNQSRPSDTAQLVTYGDADPATYDTPGQLAGRKFYLDREDAYPKDQEPWKDDSAANRMNERSTLAVEVSQRDRTFRFTLRFRDLDKEELAAVLLALCPDQFAKIIDPKDSKKYCSKLGYGRPLGLGSVCIEAKELHFLQQEANGNSTLQLETVSEWFKQNGKSEKNLLMIDEWLEVHRQKHPNAGDYPRKDGEIFTYHTQLRADHSRERRYENGSK